MKVKDLLIHGLTFMVRQLIDSQRVVLELHTQRHPQQHRQRRNVHVERSLDETWIFSKVDTKRILPCFVDCGLLLFLMFLLSCFVFYRGIHAHALL